MSIAFVFPGQGAQIVGMGAELYRTSPIARQVFDQADAVLDLPLSRLCFDGPEDVLTATENTQPALLASSLAILAILADGLDNVAHFCSEYATFVAGHSLGQYSALAAVGALSFETALQLVRRRGMLMAASGEGGMAAVIGLEAERLSAICEEIAAAGEQVVIANYNAPGQLVISGTALGLKRASERASECGALYVLPLKTSAAFHSPLIHHAAGGMAEALHAATFAAPALPVISNVTAMPLTDQEQLRSDLIAQMTAPVQWIASIRQLVAAGVDTFVEFGPSDVLLGMIKRIAPRHTRLVAVRSPEDIESLLAVVAG